ncbi:MAG TPA: hypothetical protein VFW07_14385 [Parafilimonas sp.]|nr:hypothetical protein [Parafilimonas sp.]
MSAIKIDVQLKRFDKDLFAADTNNIDASLNTLQQQYGSFLNDYLYNIMVLPPQPDSVAQKIKMFLHDYRFVYDQTQADFKNFDDEFGQIKKGLQYVKYYFPSYKMPASVITFVGPVEGYANVLTESGLAIGLQLYLGRDFSVYHSEFITGVYPDYQQRRFEPAYIAVNSMKNIVSDIYPEKNGSDPLVYQMIDAGKRLYLLDHFLPQLADSLKTGYTQKQLDDCYDNEAAIWNYLVQNNLLFITNPIQTRDFMLDGPYTEIFGKNSPGFIGQFVGWQIVKKWMSAHEETMLPQLLNIPDKQIYDEAKYKPR